MAHRQGSMIQIPTEEHNGKLKGTGTLKGSGKVDGSRPCDEGCGSQKRSENDSPA